MSTAKYEAAVGIYAFQMIDDNTIEVWSTNDPEAEFPESYIFLKDGDVKNLKDFQFEAMGWYSKNVG